MIHSKEVIHAICGETLNLSFVSQVRLEGQTEYCWLCEQPQVYNPLINLFFSVPGGRINAWMIMMLKHVLESQKLIIPFEMRGQQGVYNLERKVCLNNKFWFLFSISRDTDYTVFLLSSLLGSYCR